LPYDSEGFRDTWKLFCQMRAGKKKSVTELAATRILAKCRDWGEAIAIEALDRSIGGEWTDIYLPKSNGAAPRSKGGAPKRGPLIFKADGTYEESTL
jgi:hypothetical protein